MLFMFCITATLSLSQVWCQGGDRFPRGFGVNSSGLLPLKPVGSVHLSNASGSKDCASNCSVEDFSISYRGKVVSLRSLLCKLTGMGVQTPNESALLKAVQKAKRKRELSCRGRCGLKQRNELHFSCFCDIYCNHFGDCCYDFNSRCPKVNPRNSDSYIGRQTCENANQPNTTWCGEAMISTCPLCSANKDKASSCFSIHRTLDLRREVPVVDRRSSITYRSVTCASCNNVTNVVPWGLTVRCSFLKNVTDILDWLKRHPGRCHWKYNASSESRNSMKCTLKISSYAAWKLDEDLSVICDICNSYAMMLWFEDKLHRNPHCVLCDPKAGKSGRSCGRDANMGPLVPLSPPLTVLINFDTDERLPDAPDQRSNTKAVGHQTTYAQQVITMVGCCVSIVALLVLIAVYAMFKELRNLPGKVLMNLACSIICYQALFLCAGQTETRAVCVAIAVLLHYFLMVSFMWMAVMGYDLAKTFTSKCANVNQESTLKKLVTYCLLAWGGPLILVGTCYTLDVTGSAHFGYGIGEVCWIHRGPAKLFAVGIPVALAVLFNIVSLSRTTIAIRQAKKATQRVATQRAQPSLAFLCVKLTLVLGVPWVLGYVASYALALQFIYILLNAFQGLFVSLVFLANKRMFKLISQVCIVNSEDSTTWSQTTRKTRAYYQETKSFGEKDVTENCTKDHEFVRSTEAEMNQEEKTTRL